MAQPHGGYEADVAVVGGGPAGLTAAIALAGAGIPTALVTGRPARIDNRTTALLGGSVSALEALGVWARCSPQAAALRRMRIIDDTDRLWRAPEVRFDAAEIGLDAFGWNIENRYLVAALQSRAAETRELVRIEDEARAIEIGDAEVQIALAGGGSLTARLVVAADGRRSMCRAAAGIETDSHSYPQIA